MKIHRLGLRTVGLAALVFSLILAPLAFGQGVTTGAISGNVTDKQGHAVGGAIVTALHSESGTRATAVTRANGDYSLTGLRAGGPYTLSVSGQGMSAEPKTDIYLAAGQVFSGKDTEFVLSSEVITLAAVSVESSRDTTFNAAAMSNALNISSQDIVNVTTVRRDIQDIQNLDPRAVVMQVSPTDSQYTVSFAGQNPRSNSLLIDGVSANDNFGLNSNGYAGFRNPLPPEWIESMTIDLNPFDLIYSSFSGGVTNATLKSGTNTFHGSVYEIYTGTNFRGPDPVLGVLGAHEPMNEHTTGVTVGGPIIKDKLFFFIGYDAFREMAVPPAQNFLPDNSTGVVNQIIAQAETAYHFNPGTLIATNHVWNQNFVGKLDWNISDTQKFEFTFRHTIGEAPNFYNYTGAYYTSLSSSWYNTYRTDQSYTAKLNSDWSKIIPNFHTEIEATYKRYNGTARLNGADFPAIEVANIPGTSVAGGSAPFFLYLGQYWAYQDNNIYTWEQEEHAYGEYSIGDHTFKFGAQFDRTGYTDTFIPNILGTYYFDTLAEWQAGTPTFIQQESPYPGYSLGSDVSHYYSMNVAPLVEDTWRPNDNLTVTAGVRLDYPYEPQRPPFSPLFYNTYGYRNNSTGNGNSTLSPRVGFNYTLPTLADGLKTQVRGGAGLVLGTYPVVWYENSFNNAGQLNTISVGSTSQSASTALALPGYTFTGANPTSLIGLVPPSSAVPSFDVIDPNFKSPSNWKENIAVDRELPFWHLIVTGNIDLLQVNKDVKIYQLNYQTAAGAGMAVPAYMPDGAIRYAGVITTAESSSTFGGLYSSAYTSSSSPTYLFAGTTSTSSSTLQANKATGPVYYLTNTDKGGAQEYSFEIHRPMIDGWAFEFAYAHTHATQVDPSPSSVASSGYSDIYSVNPNDNVAGRSEYAVPDKYVLTGSKQFNFFRTKNALTTLSAQFLVQTGQAYSYVFKGDADGRGLSNASLFYVPSGPNDPTVEWASANDEAQFFTWLGQSGNYNLAKYAGHIAPRNAFYAPYQRTLNLHLEQQVPIWGPGYVTLFADCYNFGNLLNRNWGVVSNWNNSFEVRTVAGAGYDPAGNSGKGAYVYAFNYGTVTAPTTYSDMSRWSLQIGARLNF